MFKTVQLTHPVFPVQVNVRDLREVANSSAKVAYRCGCAGMAAATAMDVSAMVAGVTDFDASCNFKSGFREIF